MHDLIYVVVYGVIFASLYGIMTVGFSLICGLGLDDITLPAYMMVGAFAIVKLDPYLGQYGSLILVVVAMGFLCLVDYLVFIRPQRDNPYRVFFATILLALGVESVMAVIYSAGYSYKIAPLIAGKVDFLTVSVERQLLLGGVIGWAALFGLRYFTSHTNMGRAIIAIPQSVRGSQVIGLDVVKIHAWLVYLSEACSLASARTSTVGTSASACTCGATR